MKQILHSKYRGKKLNLYSFNQIVQVVLENPKNKLRKRKKESKAVHRKDGRPGESCITAISGRDRLIRLQFIVSKELYRDPHKKLSFFYLIGECPGVDTSPGDDTSFVAHTSQGAHTSLGLHTNPDASTSAGAHTSPGVLTSPGAHTSPGPHTSPGTYVVQVDTSCISVGVSNFVEHPLFPLCFVA